MSKQKIRLCLAGATGWTGSALTRAIVRDPAGEFIIVSAAARGSAGKDLGEALGLPKLGVAICGSVEEALKSAPADVLIDYTSPKSVKAHTLSALAKGVNVVIGTSGLTAADYSDIEKIAVQAAKGVIAAGNFSITAALAKHFSLIAARFLPHREIIDYAHGGKPDAPSGTTRELAERLAEVQPNALEVPLEQILGPREARGATVGGTQVHSVRLPGYVIAFETLFGLPDERLSIRHDAGTGAEPYVGGTLEAARRVLRMQGLVQAWTRFCLASPLAED